jgi:malonyl CoA-acyl carrier protein transacylase
LAALFERSVKVKNGAIPIVANKTGRLMQSAKTIKKNLIQQTSAPTQLNRGMAHIIDRGVEDFYNLGPGNSMFKLLGDFVALYSIRIHPVKGRF